MEWSKPENGSDLSLQKGLKNLARLSGLQELISAPWLLWGHSGLAVQKISLTTAQVAALKLAYPDIQNAIVSVNHDWYITRKYIQGVSVQDSALFITGKPMVPNNELDNCSQFFFENSKGFLDAPGEWFLDLDGTLFYIPSEGETIESTIATVPVMEQLLIIRGDDKQQVENIIFENISFQYTRYIMSFLGNEPSQAAAYTDATVIIDKVRNIQFQNCEIFHTGTNAIWLRASCADSKIEHCYFHDLGVGGIKIGEISLPKNDSMITNNIIVDNNIIRSGGHEFPTGVGIIIFNASDNVISHNEIADFGYSGISVGWVWGYKYSPTKRNKIVFNHIHHLGWGLLSDMGGVYLLGPSEGTVVSNNVIHHVYSYGYGGWGLYTDEGSTGIMLENNLVYQCKSSAFHQHYGTENIIRNNIFVSQLKAQLEATRIENHLSFSFTNNIIYFDRGVLIDKVGWEKVNFFADNNLYWDTRTKDLLFGEKTLKDWQESTGKDKHSILADPMFIDPSHYDFRFKNKSVISKIKFKPFDYTEAGVYGDTSWKHLALFDVGLADQFDKMVEQRLSEGEPPINN